VTTVDASETAAPRRSRLKVLSSVVIGLVAVVVTVVVSLADRVSVTSHDGLGRVNFGRPFGWLSQDQSGLDPPRFPMVVRLASPWENPTHAALLPLVLDVLVVYAVLMALLLGWRAARART
jgi:hypothetical protein